MKLKFYDMIEKFVSAEKDRVMKEAEKYTRSTLEGFAEVMDTRKGTKWNIAEVTEDDGRAYYDSFALKSRDGGREKRLKLLSRFLTSAINEGWITELPWTRLYEHKKGGEGHFRVTEKDRTKLIKYLKVMKAEDIWSHRDRAMVLLLLTYRLRKTEVSNIDLADYNGNTVRIRTVMEWRNREIEIDKTISMVIDSYLSKRIETGKSSSEKALFIGLKSKRISPGMINLILKELVNRGNL